MSVLLLSIILANAAGFYVYYALQLQQIKVEMREALKRIPRHELDVLKLSVQEFNQSLVEDLELEYKNKMYDVAWIERDGDQVTVFGKYDETEDSLLAMLDFLLNSPLKNKNEIPVGVWQYISMIFVIPVNTFDIPFTSTRTKTLSRYWFSTKPFITTIQVPPPRRKHQPTYF
jgi:hypothetical protein